MRLALVLAIAHAVPAAVSFNRDIRPILSDTCFRCHGQDKSSRMMDLRLDLREEALKPRKSGTPIVPGDPDNSLIVQRIFATNAKIMPPAAAHKELTETQKNLLRAWVREGARYEGHWSFQKPQRPARGDSIDYFIRARLASEKLSQQPEADRRTLIRRVTLDLTGLPPTAAEINTFLADRAPNAYAKVVDRLLGSPRYAERQTQHWLDAVRYADTCGFHGDNPFPAWPYRDYVLNSFQNNKPFDRFTREQLAGDLLPDANTETRTATTYNRLNRTSAEGGVQPKEYLAKYAADRVRTTAAVWLGLTIGCAECHDHKFDPLLQRDFYSMKAFFADIQETGLVPDRGPEAWGRLLALPTAAQQRQLADFDERIRAIEQKLAASPSVPAAWFSDLKQRLANGQPAWIIQKPTHLATANGATLSTTANNVITAEGQNPDTETYRVTLQPAPGHYRALALELNIEDNAPGSGFGRGADRVIVTEIEASSGGRQLAFTTATTNQAFARNPYVEYPPHAAIDGSHATGWGVNTYGEPRSLILALRFAQAESIDGPVEVKIHQRSQTRRATIGRFRLALSTEAHHWPQFPNNRNKTGGVPDEVAAVFNPAREGGEPADKLRAYWQWESGATAELAQLRDQRALVDATIPRIVTTQAGPPSDTRILNRGNFLDDSGEIVSPAIPAVFGKLNTTGRATRLDLANWIVSPENTLTARVIVNRQWRYFFGTGLSKALDDLGSQGEWPTHPELLDFLAVDFQRDWDIQRLIRQIVMSQTYRQASTAPAAVLERDPDNRLYARQSRFRVDAEAVRDIALSAAGLLHEQFGGPSARPYQPDGYLAMLNFPKREYAASHGVDLYRRGLYTHWQRTFLHPSLAAFDAPTREECTVNRTSSNTPLQALVLLNDPIYVEAARVFAENIVKSGGPTTAARLRYAAQRTLGRPATAQEVALLNGLYTRSLQHYRTHPHEVAPAVSAGEAPRALPPTPELAAWATVARAILNLHETITRN